MIKPTLPSNEIYRLQALRDLKILDTPSEERFDRIVRLAMRLFDVPIALVSLVDANRQWFKSCYGLDMSESSRDISFCAHAILGDDILLIPDALTDPRFYDNPFVINDPFIRFYAGCPLVGPDGNKLGTLCIIDRRPREFSEEDRASLHDLARLVEKELVSATLDRAMMIIRDSEVQKHQLLEELNSQKELTNTLFEHCAVAVVVVNTQHQVILWNKAAEELTGYHSSQMLGSSDHWKPFYEYFRPTLGDLIIDNDYEQVKTFYGDQVQPSSVITNALHGEAWLPNVNGRRRYLVFDSSPVYNGAGQLVAAITTVQDFTERKQIDDELQIQRDFALQVMNTMGQGLTVSNKDGYFEYVNPAFADFIGYTPQELTTRRLFEVAFEKDHQRIHQLRQRRINGETIHYEITLRRADGVAVDTLITSVSRYLNGEVAGSIAVYTDLTERKKVERLKNEFISTVSHELRTPLTSIRGSLGLVIGGLTGELPAAALNMVEIAQKNSERLVRLINDILDIEKIESGKMVFNLKPARLLPLLEQSLEANRGYAEQYGVIFKLTEVAPHLQANVDNDRLAQVITNFLSNAAKFSPPGEVVTVSLIEQGPMVRLSVSDRGSGISEEFKSRIFQKFAQADSSTTRRLGGTGLGLSISKAIIEHMNGQIGFETNPNGGTTFWADLPQWQEIPDINTPSTRSRILICEDDSDINTLLKMMLEETDFKIDVAFNVAEARQLLAARPDQYVALTLDLMLPDQDGISFIRELRDNEATAQLPVIVVSARAEAGHRELNGSAFAVVDWIDKPINQDRLLSAVLQASHRPNHDKRRILHLEDDQDIVQVVGGILDPVAEVIQATTVEQARRQLEAQVFDLILLDLELPDGNGLELLNYLNQQTRTRTPVVVFAARELDLEAVHRVQASLVKSRTSNQELIATIKDLIKPHN